MAGLVYLSHEMTPQEQAELGLRDFKHRTFFHHVSPERGKPGAWRGVLDETALARIEKIAGEYMHVEGYDVTEGDGHDSQRT